MVTILLIRHAHCASVGRWLAGRTPGIALDARGRNDAQALAIALGGRSLDACHASPRERALQTAEPLARTWGLQVEALTELDEVDYGEWTGRSLDSLRDDPGWVRWNRCRGSARIPGGESMTEVQQRTLAALHRIAVCHPDGTVAVVSHAEVIRAAIAHAARIPLDASLRLTIDPCSVSVVRRWGDWTELTVTNWRPGLPAG